GAASYNIYRGTSSGGETKIASGVTTTAYTDSGLSAGTTYFYEVTAVNSIGESGFSNEASATTPSAPAAPTGLTATAGPGQVALSWTASSGASSYNIYRGTSSGGETKVASGVTATAFTDTGLTPGTTYFYEVTAVNGVGESTFSNEASAVPTATITQVNLSGSFNREGIVTDGTTFSSSGGLDGKGHALSSNLLGSSVSWNAQTFNLGAANTNNVVSATGQTIALPRGNYSTLTFLATGVNGNQRNRKFIVTYTDGTTQTFTQSISGLLTPQGYSGESQAATTAYRDTSSGGRVNRTTYVYGYSFALNSGKTVQSITLPNDANVEILAMNLLNPPLSFPTQAPPAHLRTRLGLFFFSWRVECGSISSSFRAFFRGP
ncbi:MAG TPA: fibronectin type III domain-containing protein, partial [Gemmataceae bacterium]